MIKTILILLVLNITLSQTVYSNSISDTAFVSKFKLISDQFHNYIDSLYAQKAYKGSLKKYKILDVFTLKYIGDPFDVDTSESEFIKKIKFEPLYCDEELEELHELSGIGYMAYILDTLGTLIARYENRCGFPNDMLILFDSLATTVCQKMDTSLLYLIYPEDRRSCLFFDIQISNESISTEKFKRWSSLFTFKWNIGNNFEIPFKWCIWGINYNLDLICYPYTINGIGSKINYNELLTLMQNSNNTNFEFSPLVKNAQNYFIDNNFKRTQLRNDRNKR